MALAAPDTHSLTVEGISANTQSWLKLDGWDVLSHQPQDNAKDYAAEVRGIQLPQQSNAERFQGGVSRGWNTEAVFRQRLDALLLTPLPDHPPLPLNRHLTYRSVSKKE
ncbi:hypothetical protein EHF33_04555 [Deinococcus psychrotolerans]|uniref:Uncharacterized protein n=1 Tax=Deinococcus psychrotolerans TaxID=2489213 RepID=A0A3G8YHY5_9DEIO|nr:hypothetical protein [Deinococcus psychrotolerans]AZI42104.1 hypothetical protein EHF33_04555 [Deinococcus psychrotolerans]